MFPVQVQDLQGAASNEQRQAEAADDLQRNRNFAHQLAPNAALLALQLHRQLLGPPPSVAAALAPRWISAKIGVRKRFGRMLKLPVDS